MSRGREHEAAAAHAFQARQVALRIDRLIDDLNAKLAALNALLDPPEDAANGEQT